MNDNERITYEEFMIMFKNAPRIAYTLYDKAEDEIERLNNVINELVKWLIVKSNNNYKYTEYDVVLDKLNKLRGEISNMKLNNIRYTDEDINNLDDYYSKDIEEYKEIEKSLNKEINKLTAESTEWESKCYKYQDIINKLEKWLEDVNVFQMNFIENKEHITPYKAVLDKLKELKEGKE